MFSLDNFYLILNDNLLTPAGFYCYGYFYPFGSIDFKNFMPLETPIASNYKINVAYPNRVLFFDQEPLLEYTILNWYTDESGNLQMFLEEKKKIKILANSDISQTTRQFCKESQFYNWYYFFHGFVSLDWYRDYQYLTPVFETQFSKVFISLNHLMTKNRSYRLNLVANYIEKDVVSKGVVSLPLSDANNTIKGEIFNPDSLLSKDAKKLIAKHLLKLNNPYVADNGNVDGNFSAKLNLGLERSALWSVVSETIFYQNKLHLTEKIFKPIVACRPFILVGAQGNLAYLKSYGFKTFDRWIDESYDNIKDPDDRIDKITNELQRLSSLSLTELRVMEKEMREVLEHNFYHFYGDFKSRIVNELVDNFEMCLRQANNGQWGDKVLPINNVDFQKVKQLLLK
jgi:hypothetical protein